jgi:hypothetical protein
MAHIHGSPGQDTDTSGNFRHTGIILRTTLPLIFLFLLASAGLHAFLHGHYVITAFFSIFFVLLLLRYEELGLTLALRLGRTGRDAPSGQIVAKTLHLLPDAYHVFHDVASGTARTDHVVVGPGGFFVITVLPHLGRVTAVRETLRLNGWPFLGNPLDACWRRSKALLHRLGLDQSGAIQVCPVLCFSRGSTETDRLLRGVMIAQASNLTRMILEHESPLSSEKILQLTGMLSAMVRHRPGESTVSDTEEDVAFVPDGPRPVCGKCRHIPSDLEMELFPAECPKCGRLYSLSASDPAAPRRTPPLAPSAAALAAACLTIAAGSGLLAYQAGLVELPDMLRMTKPPQEQSGPSAPQAPPMSVPPAATVAPGATPAATPKAARADRQASAPAAIPDPDSGKDSSAQVTSESETSGAEASGNIAAEPPRPTENTGQDVAVAALETPSDRVAPHRTTPARPAPVSCDPAGQNASVTAQKQKKAAAPEPDAPATAPAKAAPADSGRKQAAERKSPAGLSTEGTLTVTSARPLTLWLTNDQSLKRFGPFKAGPQRPLEVVLPKGCYSVTLVENGQRRQTSVSFLSDSGHLEF